MIAHSLPSSKETGTAMCKEQPTAQAREESIMTTNVKTEERRGKSKLSIQVVMLM